MFSGIEVILASLVFFVVGFGLGHVRNKAAED